MRLKGKRDETVDNAPLDFRVVEALSAISDLNSGARLDVASSRAPIMHLILEGEARLSSKDVTVTASAGDVVFCNYGDAHSISAINGEATRAETLTWLEFAPLVPEVTARPASTVVSLLSFKLRISYLPPNFRSIRVFPSLWVNSRREKAEHLRPLRLDLPQIRQLFGGPGGSNFLANLASLLFVHGMRSMYRRVWEGRHHMLPVNNRRRIAAALLAIENNPDRIWTVESLAQTVGCSRSTFAENFKEATGETPYSFLKRLRMEHAAKLVWNSTLSIDEIARRCGYPLRASFSRAFSEHHGLPPAAMRRKGSARKSH